MKVQEAHDGGGGAKEQSRKTLWWGEAATRGIVDIARWLGEPASGEIGELAGQEVGHLQASDNAESTFRLSLRNRGQRGRANIRGGTDEGIIMCRGVLVK